MLGKICFFLLDFLAQLTITQRLWATIVFLWCALVIFYTLYLAAINVWENRHDVDWWVLLLAAPALFWMVLFDVVMNLTVFTVLMLDPPRELLVTQRMKRYRALMNNSWRKRFAAGLCTNVLNPFDPTKHHC
jgi:hypothetical protein